MLTVGAGCRVYLAAEPVDLRRGLDGLCAVVRAQLGHDPYVGDYYVFLGRRSDRVKVLYWERGGLNLHYKYLARGRFHLPRIEAGARQIEVDAMMLTMLLDGIDLRRVPPVDHWQPPTQR
jgi:transposase